MVPDATPESEPGPEIRPPEDTPRRYPSTLGGMLYLASLGAVLTGLGITALADWRDGVRVIAGGLGFAALCRLLLPRRQAGMLAVRHRAIDVGMLLGVGAVLFYLAGDIPNQPL